MLATSNEKKKKSDKDNEKEKYKTFEIKAHKKEKYSDKLDSTVKVCEDGTLKEFCKWHARFNEVRTMIPLDTLVKQVKIICNIFKESYLETKHITEIKDGKNVHLRNKTLKLDLRKPL